MKVVDYYCKAVVRHPFYEQKTCNTLLVSIADHVALDIEIDCPDCGAKSRVYQNQVWFALRVPREDSE